MVTFTKAQIASLLATLVDFLSTFVLVEWGGWYPVAGMAMGTVLGGAANFMLGRYWVFRSTEAALGSQIGKFLLVWSGNFLLNLSGSALLFKVFHVNYRISKVATAICVGWFYNYILQKRFVFKLKE